MADFKNKGEREAGPRIDDSEVQMVYNRNVQPASQMRPAKEKYAARGEVTIFNGVRPAKRVLI